MFKVLPRELAAKATRADLVELLAYYRIQEQDRKEKEWRDAIERLHAKRKVKDRER